MFEILDSDWSCHPVKTIYSIKGSIQKTRRKKHTHSCHTYSNLSQEKKPLCNQQRRPRGAARRETCTLKQSQLKAQETAAVQPTKATEGEQREGRHTLKRKKTEPRRPQYSQQRRLRETQSNHTKKDRNEKSHQRPYRYGHWLPIGVGKNGACAKTENV